MVQTRSQVKAQGNAPTVQSTTGKPVTQNTIPKVDKIPGIDKTSKYFKSSGEIPSKTQADIEKKPLT